MKEQRSRLMKGAFVLFVLVVLVIVISALVNRGEERQPTQEELRQQAADKAFKKPESVTELTGTIRDVLGATIQVEATNPADFKPHADGTARETAVWFVTVTRNTKLTLLDTRHVGDEGTFKASAIGLSDLVPGMNVTIIADRNVLEGRELNAAEIRVASR